MTQSLLFVPWNKPLSSSFSRFLRVMGVLRDHLSQAVTSLEEKETSFRIFQNNTHHLDRLVGHQLLHLLALWKSLHHRKNGCREKRKSLQNTRVEGILADDWPTQRLLRSQCRFIHCTLCYSYLHRHALTLHDNVEAISRITLPRFVGPKQRSLQASMVLRVPGRKHTINRQHSPKLPSCLLDDLRAFLFYEYNLQVQDGILELGIGNFSMNEGWIISSILILEICSNIRIYQNGCYWFK